jgi:hypothetical protein
VSDPARFLFDECLSHRVMQSLGELLRTAGVAVEFEHVITKQFGGINDDIWIPQIADERWVIVTGDRGMKQKAGKGEKLPIVCEQFGVNYVFFSRSWHNRSNADKVGALVSLWPQIMAVHSEPRGSGLTIRPLTARENELRVKLVKRDWVLPESERFEALSAAKKQHNLEGF